MQRMIFVLAAIFSLAATLVQAAGLESIEIPADAGGPAIKALVWSPCASAPADIKRGPYLIPAVQNCPVAGEKLPLIVISHGHGGAYLGHHDTAETLADAGFIVAALNHPGDTASDMSRADDISAFVERPADIKRLIDFMLGASPDAAKIDPQRIGFFGFSRGGYTGLVIGGANPDFLHANVPCPDQQARICAQILRNDVPTQTLTHDARVKAFVIADPLNVFPTADSLKDVKAPVQLWSSQHGGDGVSPGSVAALVDVLPAKPDFHIVANAAHFAFLTPCPPELLKNQPALCADAAGFDRAAFHREFDAQVLSFFRTRLVE
ncbi:serine aminopeptidase domain-containing protein [Methylocapsa sp. S129]|uniref:alpha/beta hydrolase family protein n=1 Tax=Methylocapsa sp. S129 TaxID=1641869 RepID=UPI00131DC866|nr:alpha/beta hydrolase [Methylocapsa sp. S129]